MKACDRSAWHCRFGRCASPNVTERGLPRYSTAGLNNWLWTVPSIRRTSRCGMECTSRAGAAGFAPLASMETSPSDSSSDISRKTPVPGRSASAVCSCVPANSTYQSGWPDNALEVQLANRQGGPAIPGDAVGAGAVLRMATRRSRVLDTRTALRSYSRTGDWPRCLRFRRLAMRSTSR